MTDFIKGRYPWTYAADLLRSQVKLEGDYQLSRGEAASLHHYIAKTAGIDETELAAKLADEYMRINGIAFPANPA